MYETSEVNFTGIKSRIRYLTPLSTLINNVVTMCKLKLNNLSCFVRNSYFSVDLEAMHLGFEVIDGFQPRDETAMLVDKTIANYRSYFA